MTVALDTGEQVLGALTLHGQELARARMARQRLSQVLAGHAPVTGNLMTDLPESIGISPSIFNALLHDRLGKHELVLGFAKDLIARGEDDPTSPLPEWECDARMSVCWRPRR